MVLKILFFDSIPPIHTYNQRAVLADFKNALHPPLKHVVIHKLKEKSQKMVKDEPWPHLPDGSAFSSIDQ